MTSTTTTRCTRCGRTLRSAASIARGYGRTCGARIAAAAKVAAHKPAQVEKAVELIADGGLVLRRNGRNRVFEVVASNGTDRYLTAAQACTCKAGLRGVSTCYHRIAAQLVTAA
ncbi:hypothetical protein SD37_11670 [Amycolatopsis orientalis]|uniref:SWIM-type domain-containing protein n=1 Tax=Amycolatopsis orientalis TaxID=31958 RepID=A0A193BVH9_AMYOR|nr:DUF6011 domain-containing protein [Amycolatopsis orientalis]ANN16236.1 hypothetical protein SD37_11670 [Amycolatopsis orientalis]